MLDDGMGIEIQKGWQNGVMKRYTYGVKRGIHILDSLMIVILLCIKDTQTEHVFYFTLHKQGTPVNVV